MPLPEGGKVPWPPAEWHSAYSKYQLHSAWYSGDPNVLSAYYGGVGTPNERQYLDTGIKTLTNNQTRKLWIRSLQRDLDALG